MKRQRVLVVIALLTVSGCGGGSSAGNAQKVSPSTSAASLTPSATPTPAISSGDIAACNTYLRVEPGANRDLKDGFGGLPAPIIASFFNRWADGLEPSLGTATNPTLVSAMEGTIGGLRSGAATANAFRSGDLDLVPDLRVVYEQSEQVAGVCTTADPASSYVAIVNLG